MRKGLIFIVLLFAATGAFAQSDTSKPFVLGTIEEIESKELGEKRTLNIYLPADYYLRDSITYNVIYLLDGSADEDFIHVAGLVQFNTFPWINRIPPSIVVGIANIDRRRDFTYPTTIEADKEKFPTTGHSAKFIAFIEKELQPFIEAKYKTGGGKTLIGQSLGGLLATEILFKKPALFDKYIIISPSLWWDDGSLLKLQPDVLKQDFKQKISLYIGVGKEGPGLGAKPRIMEDDVKLLVQKLRTSKNKNLAIHYEYLPKENHATIAHQAILNGFQLLWKKK